MRFKHVLGAALATVSVGVGVIVAVPGVALAHHPVVSGQAVCLNDNSGQWTVTWTATSADAPADRPFWSTKSAGWTPGNVWQSTSLDFTKTTGPYAADATSAPGQSITTTWATNTKGYSPFEATKQGDAVSRPNDCGKKLTICHVVSGNGETGNGYNVITISENAWPHPHKDHGDSLYDAGCPKTPTTVTWTPTDGTCADTNGSLSIAAGTHATYSGTPAGSQATGTTASGSFTANAGYTISGRSSFSHTFVTQGAPCIQTIQPPTISSSYDCVSDGDATFTLIPASGNWTASADQDPSKYAIAVTVTATNGYAFPAPNPRVLVLTAQEDDSCEVTPVIPVLEPAMECHAEDSLTFTDVPNVEYVVNGEVLAGTKRDLAEGEAVTITAQTDAEHRLSGPFSYEFTGGEVEDCETSLPTAHVGYDCVTSQATSWIDPASSDEWTTDIAQEGFVFTFTFTPIEGFTFGDAATEDDGSIVIVMTAQVDIACEQAVTAPVVTPPTCVAPGSFDLPDSAIYAWIDNADGTYTASANDGVRLVGQTTFGPFVLDQLTGEQCPVPDDVVTSGWVDGTWECGDTTVDQTRTTTVTRYVLVDGQWVAGEPVVTAAHQTRDLTGAEQFDCESLVPQPKIDVAALGPVCHADTPFIHYEIEVSGTTATVATLTFFDLDGKQVAQYVDVPFTGDVIYPGASLDPIDWPGWQLENGQWLTDSTDARLRDGMTVHVQVNPEADAAVTYPPAGVACNGPAVVSSAAPTTAVTAQDPPASSTPVTQLPKTGSDSVGLIAGFGTMLLLGGLVLLALVRRPRPD